MFAACRPVLLAGFPVAFSLGGIALIFAYVGHLVGAFDARFLGTMPNRVFGIMSNETLVAVPLFVFMGVTLERARSPRAAREAQRTVRRAARRAGHLGDRGRHAARREHRNRGRDGRHDGSAVAADDAAARLSPEIATGTICASGTLGQIIPPSIVLVCWATCCRPRISRRS